MLVLSRKISEKIVISTDIVVTVLNVDGDQVKLGIDAPRDISVHRQEVFDDIMRSNKDAVARLVQKDDLFLSVVRCNRRDKHEQ
jgi:carbon storage regulator